MHGSVRTEYAAKNGHIHGRVHSSRYTAVHGSYTDVYMYMAVHTARTRCVHGRITAVYTCTPYTGRMHGRYTAAYGPCKLPVHGRLRGPYTAVSRRLYVYTGRVYTRPYPAVTRPAVHRPCIRSCTWLCTQPVYVVRGSYATVYTAVQRSCARVGLYVYTGCES